MIFNNLLTAILGGIEFAAKRIRDARSLELEVAAQAARRGARLTNQMLIFSRLAAVRRVLRSHPAQGPLP